MTTTTTADGDETRDGSTGSGPMPDSSGDDSSTGDTEGECVAVPSTTEVGVQPADILVAVDNSNSMQAEALSVQGSMNAFASQISMADIDIHVVLLSDDSNNDTGICLPPPLGSGSCPDDDNPPGYVHIVDEVGSSDALQLILDHSPTWLAAFRPTASRHLMVISDDESNLPAVDFDAMLRALDPSLEDYVFHTIVAPENPTPPDCLDMATMCCDGAIPISADIGQQYIDLAALTGGVFGSICDQDLGPIFDQISIAVISEAPLACDYELPSPPDGEPLDPERVNVQFADDEGSTLEPGRVDGPTDCDGVGDGWYYDDPAMPTRITVCPQTCDQLQGLGSASITIEFGCPTIPAAQATGPGAGDGRIWAMVRGDEPAIIPPT